MDFVMFTVVFAVFFLGLVLLIQGFTRKDPISYEAPEVRGLYGEAVKRFDEPGIFHPPERHPVRLMLIGGGLIVLAVVLAIIFVA